MLDQLEGAAEHADQRVNLAAVAKGPLPHILTFGKERDWLRLRLLPCATDTYNRDYHAENAEGSQKPMLNVFRRDGDVIRHFGALNCSTRHQIPGRIPATSAPSSPVEPVRPHTRAAALRGQPI